MQLLVHSAAELVPQSNLGVQFLSAESLINTTGVPLHPAAADAFRALDGRPNTPSLPGAGVEAKAAGREGALV